MHIIRLPITESQGWECWELVPGSRGTPSAGSKANRHDAPRERAQETRSRAERRATCTSTSTLNELPILRGCGWAGEWRSEDKKRGAGGLEGFFGLGLGGRGLRTRNRGWCLEGEGPGRASQVPSTIIRAGVPSQLRSKRRRHSV